MRNAKLRLWSALLAICPLASANFMRSHHVLKARPSVSVCCSRRENGSRLGIQSHFSFLSRQSYAHIMKTRAWGFWFPFQTQKKASFQTDLRFCVALAGCRVPAGAACVQRLRRRLLQCGPGSQTRLGTVVEESARGVNQLNPAAKVLLGSRQPRLAIEYSS